MSKRQRLESLGRVVERFSAEESAEEERRSQKLMDELSSSSGRYRIK
jgi:flagellar biosynthesis chaperone FliJ